MVRRFYGLLRVCLSFCLFALVFILFALVLSLCISSGLCLCCPRLVRFCCFVFVSSFSLAVYTQKRAQFSCVLSCPVVGLLCKIGFSVLVKLVIIGLNVFFYAFVGVRVFIIVPPLLKKTFENTIDEFPRVEMFFYALVYVI